MGQVTINGIIHQVDDVVEKYVADCERDVQNALGAAEAAKGTIKALEVRVQQAIAAGEQKVKAAEAKLIGWVEARAHSFFLSVDGDFNRVRGFLQHVANGLEPHMQPATLSNPAAPVAATAAPVQVQTGGTGQAPDSAPSQTAPAPAAPASAAPAAAPSTPTPGA